MEKYYPKPLLQRFQTHTENSLMNLDELYEEIRKNLETLFNTRLRYIVLPKQLIEINNLILNYGIADFSCISNSDQTTPSLINNFIKRCIQQFEPRISEVSVQIQNRVTEDSRILKLTIEATINIIYNSKVAIFESLVNLAKHNFKFD